jgi:hypothetical protein
VARFASWWRANRGHSVPLVIKKSSKARRRVATRTGDLITLHVAPGRTDSSVTLRLDVLLESARSTGLRLDVADDRRGAPVPAAAGAAR